MRAMAITSAMLAAYAAFSLGERIDRAVQPVRRQMWLLAAAAVLGLGMWSTHFFGALEDGIPGEAVYSAKLVVLCLIAAVGLSWFGFRLVAWEAASRWRVLAGGVVLGVGVVAMELVGERALRTDAIIGYRPGWIAAGLIVSSGLSIAALAMAFGRGKDGLHTEWLRVSGSAVMGLGMAAGHMLAMRAVVLAPVSVAAPASGDLRGNGVGETALLITVGLVLLVTLGTAAIDKRRYRELSDLHGQLAASQQALLRSERQLREANELLSELSIRDGLTGLYNRRRFDEVFDMEWRRSLRTLRPLALLMIDVDSFKALNDAYGHQRGDDCLREIARVLEEHPRRGHDMVARFGGEEFAILLPGADAAGALRIGETIRATIEAQQLEHAHSPVSPWVTISVGVCSRTPRIGETAETMLYDADMALYLAKQLGRNRVEMREAAEIEV